MFDKGQNRDIYYSSLSQVRSSRARCPATALILMFYGYNFKHLWFGQQVHLGEINSKPMQYTETFSNEKLVRFSFFVFRYSKKEVSSIFVFRFSIFKKIS